MDPNPLSVESILKHMAEALPTHVKGDTNSDVSSSYEAIALFSYACMVAVGFRLLGFGENQKIESECQRVAPRLLPRWNSSFGSHAFLYAHSQSSMQYLIKVDRLGSKAEIRGIGLGGDEKITRFDLAVKDYVSSGALPLRITVDENGDENRTNLESKLETLFISRARIVDLATFFKTGIIQVLIPSLRKEGYEEATSDVGAAERERVQNMREEEHSRRQPRVDPLRADPLPEPARPYPFDDPLAVPPRRPIADFPPPDFEDEYEVNNQRGRAYAPPGAPYNIGHNDLYPPGLGPNDPFVAGGGILRPRMGGGMHPTFDDPLFGGRGGQRGGYDPRAPPGARYDPVGPGDGPPMGGSGRFPGGQGGVGGRPPNPFGGFGSNDFV